MTTLLRQVLDNQQLNADQYGDGERIDEWRSRWSS